MRYRKYNGKRINRGRYNKGNTTRDQVKEMAEGLGIPFEEAAPGKHRASQEGAEDTPPEAGEDKPSL